MERVKTVKVFVNLGNDAVQTGADVAAILRRAADALEPFENIGSHSGRVAKLLDVNGNTTGVISVGGATKVG